MTFWKLNDEPLTCAVMFTQVGSLSSNGSVYVIQSVTFRSPVLVVSRLGWSSETPVSRIPIVTPRPSQVGCAEVNCAAPVSPIGMYGLFLGVAAPGGG